MKNPNTILSTTLLAFGFFALSQFAPKAFGVLPPPDGGYPGGNTGEGHLALLSLTSGKYNTAGFSNTANGDSALFNNTIGNGNTATGSDALVSNTEGSNNTASGVEALSSNTTGGENTANGVFALFANTEGIDNTATGVGALENNTVGNSNTATGFDALLSNNTGINNTANGAGALGSNVIGNNNTATGVLALPGSTGDGNTALGFEALFNNSTGGANTAIGLGALISNSTGINNTALGFAAGSGVTTASNVICIGAAFPGANVSNSCFIGNIFGVTLGDVGTPVLVDSAGQLGTISSSRRFKKEIKPMDSASESVLALKPVTFRYKSAKKGTPQFGLIAEEVAAVNSDLVVRDKNGEIYTVRYDAVNAMLLNEFLKEHKKVEEQGRKALEQEATIAELKSTVVQQQKGMEILMAQLKEQAAQIQKVSAQVEMSRPAPQLATNKTD